MDYSLAVSFNPRAHKGRDGLLLGVVKTQS